MVACDVIHVDDAGNGVTVAKQFRVVCRGVSETSLSLQFWSFSRRSFNCRARLFVQSAHASVTSSWRAVSSQMSMSYAGTIDNNVSISLLLELSGKHARKTF